MHFDIMIYMMKKERDIEGEEAEEQAKLMLLANNPQLYEAMFIKHPDTDLLSEAWVPETPEDIEDALAFLRQHGLDDSDVDLDDNDFSRFKTMDFGKGASEADDSTSTDRETAAQRALDTQDIE